MTVGWHEVQGIDRNPSRRAFQEVSGQMRGEGAPSAEVEDDGLVDGTGEARALGRHGGHDGRVAKEVVLGPAATAGELATRTGRCDSPGSLVCGRKAAPCGLRSPARAVVRAKASAVSNLYLAGEELR